MEKPYRITDKGQRVLEKITRHNLTIVNDEIDNTWSAATRRGKKILATSKDVEEAVDKAIEILALDEEPVNSW